MLLRTVGKSRDQIVINLSSSVRGTLQKSQLRYDQTPESTTGIDILRGQVDRLDSRYSHLDQMRGLFWQCSKFISLDPELSLKLDDLWPITLGERTFQRQIRCRDRRACVE